MTDLRDRLADFLSVGGRYTAGALALACDADESDVLDALGLLADEGRARLYQRDLFLFHSYRYRRWEGVPRPRISAYRQPGDPGCGWTEPEEAR